MLVKGLYNTDSGCLTAQNINYGVASDSSKLSVKLIDVAKTIYTVPYRLYQLQMMVCTLCTCVKQEWPYYDSDRVANHDVFKRARRYYGR